MKPTQRTYQTEEEKVKYGVTTGFLSHNPIVINFSPLLQFLKGSWKREKQRVKKQGVNQANRKTMMKSSLPTGQAGLRVTY